MRAKTPKAVITFATTADALAMEAAARQHGIPGRTIPVPTQIDAGCGLAWCVEKSDAGEFFDAVEKLQLAYQGIHEVELY